MENVLEVTEGELQQLYVGAVYFNLNFRVEQVKKEGTKR